MAYSKKTWKARQGLGLNKFSIDGATPVPVVNQPDSVTQQGDALSAGNLNDLETRIDNAFTDVENGKADKAETEAILSQHDARLSNLEQIAGEYVTSDMQDYSAVPTGKATYALVETMKGVSRVENQLCDPTNYRDRESYGVKVVNNGDGTITVTQTANTSTNMGIQTNAFGVAGHVYLLLGGSSDLNLLITDNTNTQYDSGAGALLTSVAQVSISIKVENGVTYNKTVFPIVTDLTRYFNGGTIPTLAEIQSKYPELLVPRAYNAGEIVDSTYTKVESRGKNIFDIGWLLQIDGWALTGGYYTGAVNGNKDTINETLASLKLDARQIAISIKGHNSGSGNGLGIRIVYSDGTAETLYLSGTSDTTATKVSNSAKTVMGLEMTYGSGTLTSYISEFQIEFGSSVTEYSPYMTDTLPIPSVTLKGAGSASDTLDVESGEIIRRIGSVVMNTLPFEYFEALAARGVFPFQISGWKAGGEVLCARYIHIKGSDWEQDNMTIVSLTNGNPNLRIMNTSCTTVDAIRSAVSDMVLYYELATPTTESVSPKLDNTLKTEGGGTVYTDADVDGQFTLGFLNL